MTQYIYHDFHSKDNLNLGDFTLITWFFLVFSLMYINNFNSISCNFNLINSNLLISMDNFPLRILYTKKKTIAIILIKQKC